MPARVRAGQRAQGSQAQPQPGGAGGAHCAGKAASSINGPGSQQSPGKPINAASHNASVFGLLPAGAMLHCLPSSEVAAAPVLDIGLLAAPWRSLEEVAIVHSFLAHVPVAVPDRHARIAATLSFKFGRHVLPAQLRAYDQKVCPQYAHLSLFSRSFASERES